LAALATVGAAQAQSSVTVYGLYDLGYTALGFENLNGNTGAANQREIKGINKEASANGASASNRIGFRGTEDLGGGLRAGFNLEYGFSGSSTANDSDQALLSNRPRESKVFIGSNTMGTVEVGYGTTGLHSTIVGHRALGGSNFVGDLAYYDDSISGADQRMHLNAVRMNGVSYKSPVINGFSARVDYGSGSDKTDDLATNGKVSNTGLTVNYAAGALSLAGSVHKYEVQTATNTKTKYNYTAISAAYKLTNDLTLDALYAKRDTENNAGVQQSKDDVQQVGVKYAMGKTTLTAMYGTGDGETTAGTAQKDRKGMQLGAQYAFSKRTTAYALYGEQTAKYVSSGTKEKVDGIALGLRHTF